MESISDVGRTFGGAELSREEYVRVEDLYMYVGAAVPCEAAVREAESAGLFVEPLTSPYHPEPE